MNDFRLSRRGKVRVISFSFAIALVLLTANLLYMKRIKMLEQEIRYGYNESANELAQSIDEIKNTLEKEKYAYGGVMLSRLANELCSSSQRAKSALERLPIEGVSLEKTNKFLSQVGNFALSLSEKAVRGQTRSLEENEALEELYDFSQDLSEAMWEFKTELTTGDTSVLDVFEAFEESDLSEIFEELETDVAAGPKLIYDGPYSDHILEKIPKMTQNAKEVSLEQALEKASKALMAEIWQIERAEADEDGKMPSYVFKTADGGYCAITKNGGYISYMLKNRKVKAPTLSNDQALSNAKLYLESLGITDMTSSYYETYNGIFCANFAYNSDGVIFYPDLIKVCIALDNGEIMALDARGYLVNHYDRGELLATLSEVEAQNSVHPFLKIKDSELAIIPLNSKEEKLCWEFECFDPESERTVLVYINAETGIEEEILILFESENGRLTV